MIIRFCWFYLKLLQRSKVHHGGMGINGGREREMRRMPGNREEERYRGRRSSTRCYCPVCQLLEGKNWEMCWVVAYHMSFSLSLTICCYSLTCSGHLLPGKCVSMCPLPFMSVTLDLLPQPAPPTSLVYKGPPQRQVGLEQVEGRSIDAGIKEWRMAGGGGGDPWVPPR